ncbi:MAG: hypothetical protein ACRYFS_22710 [Janthinobacterium lividum]
MQHRRWFYLYRWGLSLLSLGLLAAGCSHHAPSAPAPPAAPSAAASTATPPTGQDFQPYTLLPQAAPKPPVVTHKHQVLHVTLRANHPYLVDSDGHGYQMGRDTQGHLYPIYRDQSTGASYPLYYDRDRDRLYRVARADDGRYYRGYVGDPGDRFYASDRDYDQFTPSDNDRPVVEDSYNNPYNTSNYYSGNGPNRHFHHRYDNPNQPSESSGNHHNNQDWLLAIPVVVAAYFPLQPHHHSASHPQYSHFPGQRPPTAIVRNINNNRTLINNQSITNNRVNINNVSTINNINTVNRVNNINRVTNNNHAGMPPPHLPMPLRGQPIVRPIARTHPIMPRQAPVAAAIAVSTALAVHHRVSTSPPARPHPSQRQPLAQRPVPQHHSPAFPVRHPIAVPRPVPAMHHAPVVVQRPVVARHPVVISRPAPKHFSRPVPPRVSAPAIRPARPHPAAVRHFETPRSAAAKPLPSHPSAPHRPVTSSAPRRSAPPHVDSRPAAARPHSAEISHVRSVAVPRAAAPRPRPETHRETPRSGAIVRPSEPRPSIPSHVEVRPAAARPHPAPEFRPHPVAVPHSAPRSQVPARPAARPQATHVSKPTPPPAKLDEKKEKP